MFGGVSFFVVAFARSREEHEAAGVSCLLAQQHSQVCQGLQRPDIAAVVVGVSAPVSGASWARLLEHTSCGSAGTTTQTQLLVCRP